MIPTINSSLARPYSSCRFLMKYSFGFIFLMLMVIAVSPSVSSAAFSAPVALSATGQDAFRPQVAVGRDGATTIIWPRFNGTNWIIQAATRPVGSATFSAAVNISAPGKDALSPQVEIGDDGSTTITWSRVGIIQYATRPAGSVIFSAPVGISAPGRKALSPQIATSPYGDVITWYRFNGSNNIIQAATRPAGSATFNAAVNISVPGKNAYSPQVAISRSGETTITWRRYIGNFSIIQVASRPAGSSVFSAVMNLSASGEDAAAPQVAVGPTGQTTITWYRFNGANEIVQVRTRPAGSSIFGAVNNLSAPGQDGYSPQIAVGPEGETTITWTRYNGNKNIIQVRTRPAGSGVFNAVVNLSAPGQSGHAPQIATGIEGTTTITWFRFNGNKTIIQAATRPVFSGSFNSTINISVSWQYAHHPQVVVGPNGVTTITWQSPKSNFIIKTSSG